MGAIGSGGRSGDGPHASGTPLLADLMPWSVPPLQTGRAWVTAPDPESLRARWTRLLDADTPERAAELFRPSRARSLRTAVAQLPGHTAGTGPLADADGPCPAPVRILRGAFDHQWLIPDHRLIDRARPELWRVTDDRQLFAVEQPRVPDAPGPPLVPSALLPDGRSPAGRPGRIRPLYRRPGGAEPNLAPGLLGLLSDRLGADVTAEDFLAWATATARHGAGGCGVPLTASPGLWREGVETGRRMIWLHTRGDRCADPARDRPSGRPRMPGGQRPFVRAAVPSGPAGFPASVHYDPDEQALHLGDGRIAPVPQGAWDFHAAGTRVLETWFAARSPLPAGGAEDSGANELARVRPASWPQTWTSELLELVTVLALLDGLRPAQRALAARLHAESAAITVADLHRAGVLPVLPRARRPASVLDHQEEGPGGQFALL